MDYLADMRRRYREGDLPWDDPLPPPEVIAAAAALPPGRARLLRPGAAYLLFGRLADAPIRDGLHGLSESRVRSLFATSLHLAQMEPGMTTNAEGRAVPSAWFWLTRT